MAKQLEDMTHEELLEEALKLRLLLTKQMESAGQEDRVTVEGLCTIEGKPFVVCRSGEAVWQWSPGEARAHALFVLDKATEAERDAATVAFLQSGPGMAKEETAMFLTQMREHRMDWLADFKASTFTDMAEPAAT